jgi:hypothetical protein
VIGADYKKIMIVTPLNLGQIDSIGKKNLRLQQRRALNDTGFAFRCGNYYIA